MSKTVTHEEAAEALDSLDDYARMDVGVDAMGPRGVLERYIAQQAAQSPEVSSGGTGISSGDCESIAVKEILTTADAKPVAAQPQERFAMYPAEPRALELSIAEIDALLETDCCDPLTPSQGESITLVLHELKRLKAVQPQEPTPTLEFKEDDCRQSWENTFHKVRAIISYDDWKRVWQKAVEWLNYDLAQAAPAAQPVVPEGDALRLLRAVVAELDEDAPDAPGHCHAVPGKWDKDGSHCDWCTTWADVRSFAAASSAPAEKGGT